MQHVVTIAPPAFEAQGKEATRHGTRILYIIHDGLLIVPPTLTYLALQPLSLLVHRPVRVV